MIKLIACDLDGTLLDGSHELQVEDSQVIEEIQKAGIQFMVATGRSYEGAKDLVETYGVCCDYVTLNGALIMDKHGNVLEETPIPYDTLKELITMIRKENLCFHMYGTQGTVTFDAERGRREALRHLMNHGFCEEEALMIQTKGKFGAYDKEYESEEAFYESKPVIYKIEMFMEDQQEQQSFKKQLTRVQGIEVTNSVVDNIEITASAAQKGIALKSYCQHHNIANDEVLVFGDSLNDLSMMEEFTGSFAMENAIPCIKDKANYITDTNVNHGVIKVLRALLQNQGNVDFLKNFKKDEK